MGSIKHQFFFIYLKNQKTLPVYRSLTLTFRCNKTGLRYSSPLGFQFCCTGRTFNFLPTRRMLHFLFCKNFFNLTVSRVLRGKILCLVNSPPKVNIFTKNCAKIRPVSIIFSRIRKFENDVFLFRPMYRIILKLFILPGKL